MGCVISSLRASGDFLHLAGFQVGENAVHDFRDRAVALLKRTDALGAGSCFVVESSCATVWCTAAIASACACAI